MNYITSDILNYFNRDILELDISNKNIIGPIDLKGFNRLEILCCESNEITEILNLPKTIKYLNCSKNKIKKLNNFDNFDNFDNTQINIIGLNCKSNPLEELSYPFDSKPNTINVINWAKLCQFEPTIYSHL